MDSTNLKKKKVLSASKLKTINKEQKHIWNIIPVLRLIYIYMEKDYIRTASKWWENIIQGSFQYVTV